MSVSLDPPRSIAPPSGTVPAEPASVRIPHYVVRAVLLSAVATVLVGVPCLIRNPLYTEEQALFILATHFLVLVLPMVHMLGAYQRRRDFFHPSFVAALTFIVFQIVMNPIIYGDAIILGLRNLDFSSAALRTETILHSYLVLLVAWCGYAIGHALLTDRSAGSHSIGRRPTYLFIIVAVTFVILGIIGNIGIIGGVGTYLSKMWRPWERWAEYEESMVYGGTKWLILMRFLPVGLLVLVYGIYLRWKMRPRAFYVILLAAAIANMFLSCSTGGRGLMFLTAFYGIVLVNHSVKKLSFRALLSTFVVLLVLSFILGQLRGAAYFQTEATFANSDVLVHFASIYMSNYLGTLTLVDMVETEGIVHGATAFAGVTGLLGGPTPLTTQAEVWYRTTGQYLTVNPRYGPPGELYFNFGWIGLVAGMILIGVVIRILSRAYERAAKDYSVGGGLIAVYAAFTANFLVIANLSYLPGYFTYYSLPFYSLFWLYRRRLT